MNNHHRHGYCAQFSHKFRSVWRAMLFNLLSVLTFSVLAENNAYQLQVTRIDGGLYQHTSFKQVAGFGWVDSNGLVVVNANRAIIIDTPWSEQDTDKLYQWINKQGFELIASVSTHWHEDRTAGIAYLNANNVPTYTSALTHDLLVQHAKPTASNILVTPQHIFFDGAIEVLYPGAGHSQDNLVVWLSKQRLLFGGCLVRSLQWQSLGYTGDANINQWATSIRTISSTYPSIKTIVPGHGERGDQALLSHTITLAESATAQ